MPGQWLVICGDDCLDSGPILIRCDFKISPEILNALTNAPQAYARRAGRSDLRKLLRINTLPLVCDFQDNSTAGLRKADGSNRAL